MKSIRQAKLKCTEWARKREGEKGEGKREREQKVLKIGQHGKTLKCSFTLQWAKHATCWKAYELPVCVCVCVCEGMHVCISVYVLYAFWPGHLANFNIVWTTLRVGKLKIRRGYVRYFSCKQQIFHNFPIENIYELYIWIICALALLSTVSFNCIKQF